MPEPHGPFVPAPAQVAPDRAAGRDALLAFAVVAVLVTVLVRIDVTLPAIGHLGSAFVAVTFLYVPVWIVWRRKEELHHYAFRVDPMGRSLALAGVAMAVVFPIFIAGYFAFYEIACNSSLLSNLVPRGMCARYGGLDAIHAPALSLMQPAAGAPTLSLEFCLVQLIVVALPEELFFRGFLLGLLEKRFPPKRRLAGGGIGLALVLSALAFALIHLPKDGDPRALATFFPGLLFGWMRSTTGSILGPTVLHGASNILVRALELMVTR